MGTTVCEHMRPIDGECDECNAEGAAYLAQSVVAPLHARNAELEAALRPFAEAVFNDNGDVMISTSHIEVGHYLRAKRLLSQ